MNTALMMLSEAAEQGAIDRIQNLPDAASQLADKDYWGSVGILALTGILVVFLILAILIFFFWLMGTIFKAVDKSKTDKKAAAEAAAKAELPAPAVEEAAVVESSAEDDEEELIAVISAAIAAYEGDGNFTIRNVKRHGDKNPQARSAWSMAGLNGNMSQF